MPSSFALLALSLLALLGCRSSKQNAKSYRLLLANDLLLRDGESGESFRLSVAKIISLATTVSTLPKSV